MTDKNKKAQRAALMRDPNFRWMMSGGAVSMLGDQFTLIALPWLVLKMSGDTLALGTVLAIISIPRAIFILVGGALVDRYSPKRVLMVTKHVNTLLLGALAVLVLLGAAKLWMVYLLALGIGLSTAFSIPSATSMIPYVVPREQLHAANGVMMGLRQLSMFAGPLLAGVLIALFGDGSSGGLADARGLGLAFLFDAASFALSAWTLSKVIEHARAEAASAARQPVGRAVMEGLRYCWNDASLRICFLYWAAVAFFITGPVQVALPVLAEHLPQGAAAFGALAGAHGAGTLIGMVISGARPGLRLRTLGLTMLSVDAVVGALFIPMGWISATWQGVALLLLIGVLSGFLQVIVYSWLQAYVAPAMIGRAMSVFMFIFMGIAPMAAAATGWMLRFISPNQLFMISGAMLVCIVAVTFALSGMRSISEPQSTPGLRL